LVELGDQELVALWRDLADIYKEGLVRRAGKGTEQVEKVLFASRACRYQLVGALEVRLQSVELYNELSEKRRYDMMFSRTCSSLQHTFPSDHFSPHIPTSLFLRSELGFSARPLSGHGRSEPKKPCFPQWPRIAHRPASCLSVQPSPAAVVTDTPPSSTNESDRQIPAIFIPAVRSLCRAGGALQTLLLLFLHFSTRPRAMTLQVYSRKRLDKQ